MTKYKVTVRMTTFLVAEIDAANKDEAYEIAYDLDGSCFEEEGPYSGDWEIESVEEI